MYKILIVDDEPMVIHGLCRQIDWEAYSLELAGTAETGENALVLLKQGNVDILFADICMKKMDGLTLIALAKEHNPLLRSVVISSHNEFEYVKKALQLGVENYLLKPIDQNELQKTLEKTIDNLNRDRISTISDELTQSTFRSNILDRWVNAEIQDYEFYERAELLKINISAGQYQVCVIDTIDVASEKQKMLYAKTLLEKCRNSFSEEFIVECFIDRLSRIVIVLCGGELDRKQEELELILGNIITNAKESGIETFTAVGPVSEGILKVAHDYSDAVEYMNYRFLDSSVGIVFYEGFIQAYLSVGCEPALIQLTNAFTEGDAIKAKSIAKKLMEICSQTSMETAKKCMVSILIMIVKQMNESGYKSETLSNTATTGFMTLNSLNSIEDLNKWVLEIIEEFFELMRKSKNSLHLLVQRTQSVVKKNYNMDLSLKTIALDFKVSPAYLGQLFKEETGKYFNDYLTDTRLQASRILLLETDLKIREIICRIGISNQSYYNRIFKKAYGISPLDFKYKGKNNSEA
ncbi:MAG: response regulator [Mobilitalea sp.]